MYPAGVVNPWYPVRINETSALFRSITGQSALKGAFVSAPSEPAPVVDGDFPVSEQTKSIKSSGSSWK